MGFQIKKVELADHHKLGNPTHLHFFVKQMPKWAISNTATGRNSLLPVWHLAGAALPDCISAGCGGTCRKGAGTSRNRSNAWQLFSATRAFTSAPQDTARILKRTSWGRGGKSVHHVFWEHGEVWAKRVCSQCIHTENWTEGNPSHVSNTL